MGRGNTRFVFAAALTLVLGMSLPAWADPVPFPETPRNGWDVNGVVYALEVVGDTVYVGGDFTEARAPNGTDVAPRANLAAFRLSDGGLLPFRADTNGDVRAIAATPERVFVGGEFTRIGGVSRAHLASVDPADSSINSFAPDPDGVVRALVRDRSRLYVGGLFTSIAGVRRDRVAAISPVSGSAIAGFAPVVNSEVRAIAPSPDGTTVYLGGRFTRINGADRQYLGAVNASSGATGIEFDDVGGHVFGVDVSPDGDMLYGAVGGTQNRAKAWTVDDGRRRWNVATDGDIQAIDHFEGNVYFGFHDGYQDDTTVKMLVADAARGSLESFRPAINSSFGVWAIQATPSALTVGGEFTRFEGVRTRGVAIIPSSNPVDATAPTTPTGLQSPNATATTIELSWTPSTDDTGVTGYRIVRSGLQVGIASGPRFTDRGLAPNTAYNYRVEAIDAAGNRSAPTPALTARTATRMVNAGAAWRYLDDVGGAPPGGWDDVAFDDRGWKQGPAELGYGDGDESTVIGSGTLTTYFRHTFMVDPGLQVEAAKLQIRRDDGAVVYVNGTEVFRTNMPTGPVVGDTRALDAVSGDEERRWFSSDVPPGAFVSGKNVVAVEVHQAAPGSSDMSFALQLDGRLRRVSAGPGSGTFVDDDGSIFEADIEWLAAEGVTKGCNPPTNDRYCPDDPVTRGQMAAFLVRFLGLTDDGGGNSFVDDNGSIFETDIARLAAAGITKGCNPPTNDRYCPDDPVTRGQMAAFLVRALGLTDDGGGNSFVDDNGSVFEADIARLAAAGITKGCNPPVNDRFCPNDTVTRAQMAAFLHRADPYR